MRGTDVERAPLFMNFLISLAPLRSSKSEEEEEFFQDAYSRIKISRNFLVYFDTPPFTREVVGHRVGSNEPVNYSERSKEPILLRMARGGFPFPNLARNSCLPLTVIRRCEDRLYEIS